MHTKIMSLVSGILAITTIYLFFIGDHLWGIPLLFMSIGGILNTIAIGFNNDKMPVLPQSLGHAKSLKKEPTHCHAILTKKSRCICLADIYQIPRFFTYSIGDILIVSGYAMLLIFG